MTIDEGVIKFDFSDYKPTKEVGDNDIKVIEKIRKKLFDLKLIGFYDDHQVGYGNISQRLNLTHLREVQKPQFIISGTQTGHLPDLTNKNYTYVTNYDTCKNSISSVGPILPSSESLTHASIYEANSEVRAVIHIHHHQIWKKMIESGELFTAKSIPYGTQQMANAVTQIVKDNPFKAFAMAGHDDGVITYGRDFDEALDECMRLYRSFAN